MEGVVANVKTRGAKQGGGGGRVEGHLYPTPFSTLIIHNNNNIMYIYTHLIIIYYYVLYYYSGISLVMIAVAVEEGGITQKFS